MTHKFLSTVTVLDTETTNLFPEQAEIVEIAAAKWAKNGWTTNGMLLGAKNGIPPEASAKNNISNKMITGLPTFSEKVDVIKDLLQFESTDYFVAHNSKYDQAVLSKAWQEAGLSDYAAICEDDSRWICTWRLSQHILQHEFQYCEYGLNYLRYKLDLPVPDTTQLHRATDDTYVCAVLFDYLIAIAIKNHLIDPEDDICQQLNKLCWSPIIQKTWIFGKYRGAALTDIPNDYYAWALKNIPALNESSNEYNSDLAESVRRILEKRLLES